MTFERFHAVCLKRMQRKQTSHLKIKVAISLTLILSTIFCIPKSMEYTWGTSDIRTDYDMGDKEWTKIMSQMTYSMPYDYYNYDLNTKDQLFWLQKHRDNAKQ